MFKINYKKNQNDVNYLVLVSLMLTLNIFYIFFIHVSIINFEHVFVGWDTFYTKFAY